MKGVSAKAREEILRKVRRGTWLFYLMMSAAVLGLLANSHGIPRPQADGSTPPVTRSTVQQLTKVKLLETYGTLPLQFEANQGQTDSQVKFLSRSHSYQLFLTSTEAVLSLTRIGHAEVEARDDRSDISSSKSRAQQSAIAKPPSTVLRMQLIGANPQSQGVGLEELPGKANYFIGNDPQQWRINIPTYAKVRYREVYPGIDLVYYGNQRHLEYDFVVAPGVDLNTITLAFQGADTLEINTQSDLILQTAHGQIYLRKPYVYQEVDGVQQEISGRYVLKDDHQIGFQVGAYDADRPLIIDPTLVYSTYLCGNSSDVGLDIAVDAAGNAYMTGYTWSSDFPKTPGALQPPETHLPSDVFVTKLKADGTALLYSTYLSGTQGNILTDDARNSIAVDAVGNAYITGYTWHTDFPTTPGAFQPGGNHFQCAFVTKLSASGAALVYSTYLRGTGPAGFGIGNFGTAIAVDATGHAYVTGNVNITGFPTTPGAARCVKDARR